MRVVGSRSMICDLRPVLYFCFYIAGHPAHRQLPGERLHQGGDEGDVGVPQDHGPGGPRRLVHRGPCQTSNTRTHERKEPPRESKISLPSSHRGRVSTCAAASPRGKPAGRESSSNSRVVAMVGRCARRALSRARAAVAKKESAATPPARRPRPARPPPLAPPHPPRLLRRAAGAHPDAARALGGDHNRDIPQGRRKTVSSKFSGLTKA